MPEKCLFLTSKTNSQLILQPNPAGLDIPEQPIDGSLFTGTAIAIHNLLRGKPAIALATSDIHEPQKRTKGASYISPVRSAGEGLNQHNEKALKARFTTHWLRG
jgi:hypothetical protein